MICSVVFPALHTNMNALVAALSPLSLTAACLKVSREANVLSFVSSGSQTFKLLGNAETLGLALSLRPFASLSFSSLASWMSL